MSIVNPFNQGRSIRAHLLHYASGGFSPWKVHSGARWLSRPIIILGLFFSFLLQVVCSGVERLGSWSALEHVRE